MCPFGNNLLTNNFVVSLGYPKDIATIYVMTYNISTDFKHLLPLPYIFSPSHSRIIYIILQCDNF